MSHKGLLNTFEQLISSYEIDRKNTKDIDISVKEIIAFLKDTKKILLPEYFGDKEAEFTLEHIMEFQNKVQHVMRYKGGCVSTEVNSIKFVQALPTLRQQILLDIEAAFRRDPAAKSYEEVVLTYPGVYSIIVHRISNIFYQMDYSLIARAMSEHAHSKTGIDIHPGATIGHSFFMDHGTGIVVGETAQIGDNVTLYQGVTLGAFSFKKDDNGEIIKGLKRHPTIEDDVTIYAGATILGGNTIIGKGSVIGGNVWLTKSVEPGTKVITEIQNRILN